MGPFNLERSLCQDQAEYDTSDSGGLQSLFLSISLFFTLSTVAATILPFCLSVSFCPSDSLLFTSFFSASQDVSLQKQIYKKITQRTGNTQCSHVHVFKRYHMSLFTCRGESSVFPLRPFWFYVLLYYISCYYGWCLICFKFFGC